MRVNVDRALCESNAICMSIAPEVFEVGEDDVLHILTAEPAEPLRRKVEQAVQCCPKGALSVEDA